MPKQKLTAEIIAAAILGFEQQKRHIDTKIAELRAMLPGGRTETTATPEAPKGKRRRMSTAGRARIAEAQRKRWAESKKTSSPVAPEVPKPKRRLSAAGKKAISEATKKRWARVRAEAAEAAKAQQAPAAKKTAKKAPVKTAKKGAAPPPSVPAATA
jgi:hypothetical protein